MADSVDFSIAVRPNDLDAVPGIVKGIVDKANALSPGDETARHALLIQARSLVQALETPRETMTKHTWAQVRITLSKVALGIILISITASWAWTQVWSLGLTQVFGYSWPRMATDLKTLLISRTHWVLIRCFLVSSYDFTRFVGHCLASASHTLNLT